MLMMLALGSLNPSSYSVELLRLIWLQARDIGEGV